MTNLERDDVIRIAEGVLSNLQLHVQDQTEHNINTQTINLTYNGEIVSSVILNQKWTPPTY
jgi:hypothetical protein